MAKNGRLTHDGLKYVLGVHESLGFCLGLKAVLNHWLHHAVAVFTHHKLIARHIFAGEDLIVQPVTFRRAFGVLAGFKRSGMRS